MKNLVRLIFIIFISLILIESTTRLLDNRELLTLRNWVTESLENQTENHSSRYDAKLGWSGKPNLNIKGIFLDDPNIPDYSDLIITTNADGFRSTGQLSDATPKQQLIITIGDSFTWGAEVNDLETYPARLQDILQVPVTNASYGGWGTDQMWLRLQDVATSENPSLIILSPLSDDVLRNAFRRYGRAFKPYFELVDGKPLVRNTPVPRNSSRSEDVGVLQSWFGRFYFATFASRMLGLEEIWINRNRLNDRVHSNEDAVEIACRLLHEVVDFGEKKEIPIVLTLLYGGREISQGKRHWFTERYSTCAQEAGIPLVDTFDDFVHVSRTQSNFPASHYRVWNNGAVAHMNPTGHQFVAEIIVRELREKGYFH